MADFLLPDLGEGLSEAEVIAWRVSPGDRVSVDQVIAEVETAKAVVEVPVPYAGVVAALHATPGSVVSVGQPLISVTEDGAGGFREPGVVVPEQVPGEADADEADGAEEASGSVLIGYGTTVAPAADATRPASGGCWGVACGCCGVPIFCTSCVIGGFGSLGSLGGFGSGGGYLSACAQGGQGRRAGSGRSRRDRA